MKRDRDQLEELFEQLCGVPAKTEACSEPNADVWLRYDVLLRSGFDTSFAGLPRKRNREWRKNHDLCVHEYSLNSVFGEIFGDLGRSDSRYLVFVDDVIAGMDQMLAQLNVVLDANPDLDVLTFQSPALVNLQVAGASTHDTTTLPSWFCVVSRTILHEYGPDSSTYNTLEFFLLGLAANLKKDGIVPIVSDALNLQFDYAGWVADLLLKNSPRLEADFRKARQIVDAEAVPVAVPDQFKIIISGDYTELPAVGQNALALPESAPQNPTFSVICPVFKSSFLTEMVESVRQQSWRDWEFIMVVDGPPEDELERILKILESYSADERIAWIVQENQGTGPTRKRLAEMARGRIVVPVDDDDYLHPDLLMSFKRAYDTNPKVKVLRGGAQLCGLIDTYLTPRQRVIVSGISADIFEVTQPYAVERDILIELGGYKGDQTYGEAGEDSDLFLKIDHAGLETCLIDQPLYFRRITAINQTLSFDPEVCLAHLKQLIGLHLSSDWEFVDLKFAADQGGFTKSAAIYRNRDTGREIVTATRFFDYQTLGSKLDVTIDLEITTRCDVDSSPAATLGDTPGSTFMRPELIELLARQIAQREVKNDVMIGGSGEPTLHPRLTSIVKKLSKAGASVTLRTTGHNLNAELLAELVASGLAAVDFSVNAHTSMVYERVMCLSDLERVKANLRTAIQYRKARAPNFEIQASFVYCQQNQAELTSFISEWKGSGVSSIRIRPLTRRGGIFSRNLAAADLSSIPALVVDEEQVVIESDQHRPEDGNVCRIVQQNDVIGCDGELLLCGLDEERAVTLGNLQSSLLQDLHLSKFLRYKRGEINAICSGCQFCP